MTMYALISYKIRILTLESTCGMAVLVQYKTKAHDTRTSENDWCLL